jgi:hypothetical protein
MSTPTITPPGWYQSNGGMHWWTGSEWNDSAAEWSVANTRPDPFFQPPQFPPKKSHTARKVLLICGGAIVVLIVIISIATSGHGGSSGPALTPGSATVDQICQTFVGDTITNTLTGNDSGTVSSVADGSLISNVNASGNEVVTCTITESDGDVAPVTATLFANGSTSWYSS